MNTDSKVKVVIPGYGKHSDGRFLDYTIAMYK